MDGAEGQLHVQKVPRWRLTIKSLQEEVELARSREPLCCGRPGGPDEKGPVCSVCLIRGGQVILGMEP